MQEYCQSEKNIVYYSLINISEKDGRKEFLVEAYDLFGKIKDLGNGLTKKEAEQKAAYNAMTRLKLL